MRSTVGKPIGAPHDGLTIASMPTEIVRGRDSLLKWCVLALVVVIPVGYGFIINTGALDNPPAWDSSTTVSPAALTIVDREFDIWEVAQLPSSLEGGPSIHATSIYTIALALLISLFGPATAFYLAHLGSILLIGVFSTATYLVARLRASVYVSALCAVTVSIVPLVVQQSSDLYIDLPLAVLATLACWTACRRKFWTTTLLVVVAVAVKTSGVFLIPLLLFAQPSDRSRKHRLLAATGGAALALIPFLAAFVNTDRFERGGLLSGTFTLLGSSASLLFETLDVFIILSIYVIATYGKARSRNLDRPTFMSAVMVSSFFVVYGGTMVLTQTIAILPRYYLVLLPAMLVSLLPAEHGRGHERGRVQLASLGLVTALALFSLVNVRGDFYPLPNNEFYVSAERSTRAQDLLKLQIAGTRMLVATDLPVVVDGPIDFRLKYPDLGYVTASPDTVITTYQLPRDLPDEFAMLIERRYANPLVEVEKRAKQEGYKLKYQEIWYDGYQSELIVASR